METVPITDAVSSSIDLSSPRPSPVPDHVISDDSLLPKQIILMYGCSGCEWSDTSLCPHYSDDNDSYKTIKGICDIRRDYLLNIYTGCKSSMSVTEWNECYQHYVLMRREMKERLELEDIEDKLRRLSVSLSTNVNKHGISIPEKDFDYRTLEMKQDRLRKRWLELIKLISKSTSDKLDRDSPKKLEISDVRMDIRNIHRLMRGDVVEAEVVGDDKTGWVNDDEN